MIKWGNVLTTGLTFFLLPYLFVGGLALLLKWPWEILGTIAVVIGLPLVGCFLYGWHLGGQDIKAAKAKEERNRRALALHATHPGAPDDVPATPIDRRRPLALPAPQLKLPAPYGHQWRGRLK